VIDLTVSGTAVFVAGRVAVRIPSDADQRSEVMAIAIPR
jgi:hypothetical protein